MEKAAQPFTPLSIEDINFASLESGVLFYAERIKLRLKYIHGFKGKNVGLIEIENIIFQLRCITETYSDYVIFLFESTTEEGVTKSTKSLYAADKRLKKMSTAGMYALISANNFQNHVRLQKANLIDEKGFMTYLGYSYFRDIFSKCGNFLHEDKPMKGPNRALMDMFNFAAEHGQKIEAWFWQHWIACEGFNIFVNFGEDYESETSIRFLDLRD